MFPTIYRLLATITRLGQSLADVTTIGLRIAPGTPTSRLFTLKFSTFRHPDMAIDSRRTSGRLCRLRTRGLQHHPR